MSYGYGAYGRYVYGLEELVLTGEGGSEGEFEEDYGEKWGGSTGRFDADYSFIASGVGGSENTAALELSLLASGQGGSEGVVDFELIAAITDYACYVLNIDTKKTYQFDNYGFLGIGRFNGRLIGIKDDKVYDLETAATTDDGADIEAYWEIETDFGMPAQKEIRRLFHEDDAVTVTITDSAGSATVISLSAAEFQALPRSLVSRAFTLKFSNIAGSQITFRRIYGDLNVLDMKRG